VFVYCGTVSRRSPAGAGMKTAVGAAVAPETPPAAAAPEAAIPLDCPDPAAADPADAPAPADGAPPTIVPVPGPPGMVPWHVSIPNTPNAAVTSTAFVASRRPAAFERR